MQNLEPYACNLADFWDGDPDDPLRAPRDFTAWREATRREQSLFQRPLRGAPGVHTRVEAAGKVREVLNIASLDYLGLNGEPAIARAIAEALPEWGVGACGVPLLTGTSALHQALEDEVSTLTGREHAMLFPSGFSGGVGIASALLRRGDVAIVDEKAHMCWLDGIRLAGAQLVMFPHADTAALDRELDRHRGRRRVAVVDGLYSMDGDVADLPALLEVTDAHGVGLIVDEAHSIFALGDSGGGVTEITGMQQRVRLLFGTFSKGLAMLGGFAAGERALIDYTRMYAHPFAFSAALPPAYVAGMRVAVAIAANARERRRRLADNAEYWRKSLRAMGLDTGNSTTHVVPIMLGTHRDLLFASALEMFERGLYVVAIDYPAVPQDGVRLRTSISAAHARADLDRALNIIEDVLVAGLRERGGLRFKVA